MHIPELDQLTELVRNAAAQHLLPYFGHTTREYKADRSVVTEADLAMQQHLQSEFQRHWPQFQLLAEEMTREQQLAQLQSPESGLWIVDPLDGTSNFAAGIPYFSVSVAFYMKGDVQLALVYDPVRDEMFAAAAGQGAQLNGEPLQQQSTPASLARSIAVVDFKRLSPEMATRLAMRPPYGSQRSFGSVALDWCWLAANRFHVYLHGRQNIWDYAAGEMIFSETGGQSISLDGDAVFRPSIEPRSAVAAYDAGLFAEWSDWLGVAKGGHAGS
ncbi:MAG: inositol monophosphatase family protein [Chromatiales bacterium]